MLMLDNFTTAPPYLLLTLPPAPTKLTKGTTNTTSSPPPLLLRETVFSNGVLNDPTNQWNQPSTLEIGTQPKGILIVNTGFGAVSSLFVNYGTYINSKPAPLSLNLSAFSGLRLNFAGLATNSTLSVDLNVATPDGLNHDQNPKSFPSLHIAPFSLDFPWTKFNNQPLNPSAIVGIQFVVGVGGTNSFGITSLEAVP